MLNNRNFVRPATAILGAALLLGAAAPALAQEKAKEPEERSVHNIIIKRVGKDGDRIRIDGKELSELTAKCASSNKDEADVTSGEGKDKFRTRIIMCSDDKNANSAERRAKLADALDKARTRLRDEEALSEKGKALAIEALDREIARLRSGG